MDNTGKINETEIRRLRRPKKFKMKFSFGFELRLAYSRSQLESRDSSLQTNSIVCVSRANCVLVVGPTSSTLQNTNHDMHNPCL